MHMNLQTLYTAKEQRCCSTRLSVEAAAAAGGGQGGTSCWVCRVSQWRWVVLQRSPEFSSLGNASFGSSGALKFLLLCFVLSFHRSRATPRRSQLTGSTRTTVDVPPQRPNVEDLTFGGQWGAGLVARPYISRLHSFQLSFPPALHRLPFLVPVFSSPRPHLQFHGISFLSCWSAASSKIPVMILGDRLGLKEGKWTLSTEYSR